MIHKRTHAQLQLQILKSLSQLGHAKYKVDVNTLGPSSYIL